MQPKNLEKLGPRLRKALKGKTCFHIKEIDQELTKEIENGLADGFRGYQKLGFI
jgi:hypothetical protein